MNGSRSERGTALLAVLALLVMLGSFATLGLERLRAATDRLNDADQRSEATLVAAAAVEAALPIVTRLKAVARQNPEQFRKPVEFETAGGHARMQFADAGLCFNLNSMATGPQRRPAQTRPAQFAKFLVATGVEQMEADKLARATADLLAESQILWADPGEWATIEGVTPQHLALAGHLMCALPTREASPINVNLLDPGHAPLLVAVGLSVDEARRAIASRPREGWSSSGDFWQLASPGGTPETAGAQVVGTSSRWISLHVRATAQNAPHAPVERLYLLDSISTPARVISSTWLPAEQIHETSS